MCTVGQRERLTQNRIVKLFREMLGYTYLGDWEDRPDNRNIEESLLLAYLKERKVKESLISKALYELNKAAGDQNKSLYDINKEVYSLLRYGVKVRADVGENTKTVWLIDWEHPLENHFAIAEEVTVSGQHDKRPDIVLYVNGIALGVLELKRSTVAVSEGIRQNLDSQKKIFIQGFFTTVQFVMAGNDTEGLRYAAIETPEKYYMTWKEASAVENPLDRSLTQLCEKTRLLEIIHDFMVFDAGIKKMCRPNQYFGVKAAQERIRKREGGIIWHTQGSGKSLIMVWIAKWIRENITGSRVLIITDRIELDEQIEKVFKGVTEDIHRTKSGADLVGCLNAARPWLLCSLIHKFAAREEGDIAGYIEEIQHSLPPDFVAKGDLYVFVDECHRTQSGDLHKAMKAILPNVMFLGFTGTPLLSADKQKSIEVFGSYIHTYKYDEAVKDKVVLDLRYEARDIDQNITSQEKIDQWFEAKTIGLTDIARAQLKQRWGTMQVVLSSQDRLEKIVADILLDMEIRDRLQSDHGNALLVSGSIYQACKFYELFISHGFDKCAIITSYRPSIADVKGEESGEGETEQLHQFEIYNWMLNGKDVETFEKEVKKKFIEEPGQMKLLIVVDKLLTGFDAPPATYLYIDKQMRDHGLFQAICRVNRLDTDDKEYGYIIDYKDLFQSLEGAVRDYTSGAFDGYDKEDVLDLLTDRLEKARERLEETREAIKALCEAVDPPKDTAAYIRYFCASDTADKDALKDNEPKRIALYKLTVSFIRAYANLANEMPDSGYTAQETEKIKQEVDHYEKARSEVKLASGDYIDLKMYEPAMRHLIDTYIRAEESRKISAFDDMTLIQLIVERGVDCIKELPEGIASNPTAIAETIENNLRRVIIDEQPINPRYYERMSELLDTLIRERKSQAHVYEKYLEKLVELIRQVKNPSSTTYPKLLTTSARRALYDNLGQNTELALALDTEILATRQDDWRGHLIKERQVRYAIQKYIEDEAEAERIFELVKNQREY
ncbi:MAG: type I restriction endonuclease subunit R [Candidatus Edwardsbacteria bacterium]|nr:type I restriction endonuclease subunit R [Candidatus Edwardsbacteria bacterium]